MAAKPAITLLHLGPGYLNGAANLHNARRAFTPVVNVIGDHATYHRQYDAPLTSNILGLAGPNSLWLRLAESADAAADLAAEAVRASFGTPGGPVSLILPADCAWSPASRKGPILDRPTPAPPTSDQVDEAARRLKAANKPVVVLGSGACSERGLRAASRLSGLGVRVITDTFLARQPRGAGRFAPDKMLYFAEMAVEDLAGSDLMVLVETASPVAFFVSLRTGPPVRG
jgi:acetolactate synthase-1/2/3 large subunit